MVTRRDTRPPWKRKNPNTAATHLSPREKSEARKRARNAGRKYPNLVDNMAVVGARKKTKAAGTRRKKASAQRSNTR